MLFPLVLQVGTRWKLRSVETFSVKIGGIKTKSFTIPVISRNQGAIASCKTLSGGPSVDGLGIIGSGSMMSAVGLELTNFINPDLTWKKVTKGYRSASRRKSVVRSFTVEAKVSDESSRTADDMTVSDTEKHGVAVLGRRFSGKNEKNEHVPIKKRRFSAQGPSKPSHTTSPHFELVLPNSSGKRRRRATDVTVPTKLSLKTSEVNNKFDYSDDFSGIEILASVACNNSMINDACDEESSVMEESTREGVGSSSSAVPIKETAASPKDMAHEDKTEALSPQNNEVTVLHTSAETEEGGTGERSLLSRDEMLSLDLNVAWEQPCDTMSFDPSENDLQTCKVKPEALKQHNPPDRVVSSDFHRDDAPVDLIGLSIGTCESNREEHTSEACSLHDGNNEEHFPSPTSNAPEPSICDVAVAKSSSQIVEREESLDHPPCNTLPSLTLKQCSETCSSDDQKEKVLRMECVQVESINLSLHHLPNLERVACEIDPSISNDDGENSQIASCTHENGKSIQNTSSLENLPPIGPAWLGVDAGSCEEEPGGCHCLPNSGDIYESSPPAEKGQLVIEVDTRGTNEASAANEAEVHSPVQAGSEELLQKSSVDSTVTPGDACGAHGSGFTSVSANVNMEDLEDSFESDVYQADKVHIVGTENDLELQAGYESQFEDGELRESDACFYWDENGEDGEVEHVDYGSGCDEERVCGMDNEKEMKVERGFSSGSDDASRKIEHGMGGSMRGDSVSPKTRTSDVTPDKDFLSGVAGSRKSNRDFLSSIVEPSSIFRKDPTLRSRTDNLYNLYPRDERGEGSHKFTGRDRIVPQMHGRSPVGHRFVNPTTGHCDSERRYFSNYRGNYNSGHPRTRGGFDSRRYVISSDHNNTEGTGFAGSDNRAHRRFINPPSNGTYERIVRRRSPTGRDDSYRLHTGALPVRDGSPIRSGFRRFPPREVARGGLREEYHRPVPEDKIEYSHRFAPRMLRRERSISPPLSRGQPRYPFTHKKSRSRSRSRSPSLYLSRVRNDVSRLRSRSPDFRTDGRVDRVRLPFQKRFPADFEGDFMPTRRNHFTQHNPGWFDDRNGGLDSFRGRKSPVNMFRSNQRFDSVRTNRRLDSEDQFRPMMRSRKFKDTGSASRGGEFDGSDDDRRKHNRYDMVQRVRQYDTDSMRRFRFNAEDSLVANDDTPNSDDGNRITDRRPGVAHRRDGEE
ncbi:DENTIN SIALOPHOSPHOPROTEIN-LIKE PROTEIN [Salix koriyanagi]|uniref:DENTIN SIALOPHOSPHOPROTEIN-LIKE PROTEIN n=2 Tax=Salix koriyanagi TaxID=2511006 RepID=A0A9Q0UXS3_9ROSI|nr:DENTIN SIALOPHOSPHOPROTEIN-LIKE PROTEIN [Salix koriyanagi]